jgi:ABC-2 type transport system permease protein
MDYAIETFKLTKRFPRQTGWRRLFFPGDLGPPAVDGVDLAIRQGELFGLLGPNGAGKTTLVKMLSTLILPTSGTARVNGFELRQETGIKASLGLVTSDERSFYWRLTGRQNLAFFASLHNLPPGAVQGRVQAALEQMGLLEIADQRFDTYSTGMRQRLSIARALLVQPRLLCLDEPTRGLDPLAQRSLRRLIRDQLSQQQGLTILLATHDLEEAETLCDRVAIMHHGQVLACGAVSELRQALDLGERYRLAVAGLTPRTLERLEARLGAVHTSPLPAGEAASSGETLLEFDEHPAARNGHANPAIHDALDILRDGQATLYSVDQSRASLEDIFTDIVMRGKASYPAVPAPPAPSPAFAPVAQPRSPRTVDRSPLSQAILPTLLAFLKRDFQVESSYRFAFLMQLFGIFFSVGVFYYVSRLLGAAAAPFLAPYGGDYFAFVLIGIAFSGYFGVGLSSFGNSLRQAQISGTLEAMLAAPTRLSLIILASAQWDYLMTTLRVLVYLAVGAGLLGVDLGGGNYLAALLVLALTIVTFSSLGVLSASFIMVLKRGDPITWAFGALSTLLGGVYYPVTVLPGWLQSVSNLFPITYALHAMRLALLRGASFRVLLPDLAALAFFSVGLLPLSLLAFHYAVRRARREGSLTHY